MLVVAVLVERGRHAAAGAVVCQAEGVEVKLTKVEAKHVARAIGRNAAESEYAVDVWEWWEEVKRYTLWESVREVLDVATSEQYAEEGRAMHAAANTNNREGKS